MAEMKVPACPMPIHQTKSTMPSAHPTGMLFPQTPMPVVAVYVSAANNKRLPAPVANRSGVKPRRPLRSGAMSWSVSWAFPGSPSRTSLSDEARREAEARAAVIRPRAPGFGSEA